MNARTGDTTEVKSVGVNYIIKAKMVALPADLASGVEEYINDNAKSPISTNNKLVTESDLPVIESGEAQATGGIATVSFTGTHSSAPKAVVVSALEDTGSTRIAWIRAKTSSGFTAAVTNAAETGATCKFEWIAMW